MGMRGRLSHGLALNALAHYEPSAVDKKMAAAARKLMTKADLKSLRIGG